MNQIIGVFLHALGGLAAGSFYVPLKKIDNWSWETYWIVNGFISWMIMPWVIAHFTVPDLMYILTNAPASSLFWSFLYGVLWGIGGLTYGLTMRYLGLSLGNAVAIGFTAAFGTLVPPIYFGEFAQLLVNLSGQVTIGGVMVSLFGIAVVGWAGWLKDHELSDKEMQEGVEEFDFIKGFWVAVFAGLMSACMSFGFQAGKPIAELAIERGTSTIWQNSPVLIVIFAGGFVTNFTWCMILNVQNNSFSDYWNESSLKLNYLLAVSAGVIWYLQFMFYGMGASKLGEYEFASWSIHMSLVILVSNMWGILSGEWKGSGRKTMTLISIGLVVLILSTMVIGYGNYLETLS